MAETSPIRYSFGGDEHLFAEVSDSMSLEAFFKGMAVTRAVERLALEGVLDVCLANASFQIRFDPDRIAPHALLDAVQAQAGRAIWWVRDITLSNTMWGNRAPVLDHPRAGVHALGGGIGQGLAMAVGAAVANAEHGLARRTVALAGDGGFMLNLGELACAAQEGARFVLILMNDRRYGVIRNIQDDLYGGRHCYVDLRTPDMRQLCAAPATDKAAHDHPAPIAA